MTHKEQGGVISFTRDEAFLVILLFFPSALLVLVCCCILQYLLLLTYDTYIIYNYMLQTNKQTKSS